VLFQGGALFGLHDSIRNVAFQLKEKTKLAEGNQGQGIQALEDVGLKGMGTSIRRN
jgi:ABC-type transporter Mla maintaining outer membrane lipid asymmetry ATPase subunit MlaF